MASDNLVQMPTEQPLLLAGLPPTHWHLRIALGVVATLLIGLVVTLPFQTIPLPHVSAFIPVLQIAITINDLITATLLYAQYTVGRQRALLVLASGYVFSGLIVIPYALTFPGGYVATSLLGGGLQTTPWIYWFWHAGLPLAVIAYVLLKDVNRNKGAPQRNLVGWSIGVVIALICGLTLFVTAGASFLPKILTDSVAVNVSLGVSLFFGGSLVLLIVVALALLWTRRNSVLDLFLMVMCFAWLIEIVLGTVLNTSRFSVGWYGSRICSFIAAIVLLIVLLSETTRLYASLAQSILRQRSAREARQIETDAMAASIAHEVSQPLGSVVLNVATATTLLSRETPDLEGALSALEDVERDARRASEVVGAVRSMFRKDRHGSALLDASDVIREVIDILDVELRTQRVSVSTKFHQKLPRLFADRGQLHQVILNLMTNAIEAMTTITDRPRLLRLTSDVAPNADSIIIAVEDSGAGVNQEDVDRIFDPFFTTKSTGTGIGLSVCRSIIEAHGGSLKVSANSPHGMIFHFDLPIAGS